MIEDYTEARTKAISQEYTGGCDALLGIACCVGRLDTHQNGVGTSEAGQREGGIQQTSFVRPVELPQQYRSNDRQALAAEDQEGSDAWELVR